MLSKYLFVCFRPLCVLIFVHVFVTGDNLIIGSYDKRLTWFDMDLSSKPYKVLR